MRNLYWKSCGTTRTLIEKPFKSEAELEAFIFANQDILGGDVFILYRQIRTGAKQGIPDMLGVDQDDQVCLIELKNVEAGEEILPQALGYAIWAETNPDSIRAIWLESKTKPEDAQIDWDNLSIRVILIAPSFKSTVPRMAGKLGYPIDLIQVSRYALEDDEFLVVESVEEPQRPKVGTTTARKEWNPDTYEEDHGKEATAQFMHAVQAVERLSAKQGWEIPFRFNKYYTGFYLGNKLVFNVAWGGTRAWNVRFKLPEDVARAFHGQQWEFQRYDSSFHEAVYRPLQPGSPDLTELEPLFVKAYEYVSGAK
jgi:hypothetical protein